MANGLKTVYLDSSILGLLEQVGTRAFTWIETLIRGILCVKHKSQLSLVLEILDLQDTTLDTAGNSGKYVS